MRRRHSRVEPTRFTVPKSTVDYRTIYQGPNYCLRAAAVCMVLVSVLVAYYWFN